MNQIVEGLLLQLKKIEYGFKHIIIAGDTLLQHKDINHFDTCILLLQEDSYQTRMLATYILGQLSPENSGALKTLETVVAHDENWRVQEMLAKAFDSYCQKTGYEASLPKIRQWLNNENPNVKGP
ncbi:HEAT repeat domain-containing protein [Flavobacterium rhizosphaerae]|uniref:HEAT repeat domain-containing protein n=1 Tax=Flavobacterium rhizosphaerae TaxID=3163298 RepID=A0ABW8YU82_9FLAO